MARSTVRDGVSDVEPDPEEAPSFHDAFAEDRERAYREFAATGLLTVGAMLVAAGLIRPTAPGSPLGMALGVVLLGFGLVVLYLELRSHREEASAETAEA